MGDGCSGPSEANHTPGTRGEEHGASSGTPTVPGGAGGAAAEQAADKVDAEAAKNIICVAIAQFDYIGKFKVYNWMH